MTSSTLSMTKPLRPTTRPLRTKKTWTAASSSSLGDADHVEVLGPLGDHRLLLDGLADADQPVAQAGRPLELEASTPPPASDARAGARSAGCRRRGSRSARRPAGRTRPRRSRRRTARCTSRCGRAGTAGPDAWWRPNLLSRAGADRERPQEQVERLPDGVGVAVGPEVAGALALLPRMTMARGHSSSMVIARNG